MRLDSLLPSDPHTQAVTEEALRAYVQSMMELVTRTNNPLTLIAFAIDENPMLTTFRREDMGLVGRAVVRCVQQETRTYDVIGQTDATDACGLPVFLLACPLMNESQARALAERLRNAMIAYAREADQAWLTLSFGLAGLTIDIQDARDLIARAIATLRRAQRRGNSTALYSVLQQHAQEDARHNGTGIP
ncbi:MAG: hypothetical protein RMJ43_05045 [Chloroherpetonaceae bacterium]|nr:hypothetical protein [Chthonomonadaceae bacterium]MDW8207182.1 hypothetical protein [Chloroherpetonaceae bacterium]